MITKTCLIWLAENVKQRMLWAESQVAEKQGAVVMGTVKAIVNSWEWSVLLNTT